MYLKRLELHGFKSFAQRTVLEFSPGITAIVGPNGSGKCVDGNTLVTLSDGKELPIRDLVDAAIAATPAPERLDDGLLTRDNPSGVQILSLNPATLRLEPRPVSAFIKRQAPAHLLRIKTRSGREVTATPYHPLFTLDHGHLRALRAEELRPGIRLALPRRLPITSCDVSLNPSTVMSCFDEVDRVYVPYSDSLRTWALSARQQFGTWVKWREAAGVSHLQLKGLLDGQSVNSAVLQRLAGVALTPPPLDGHLKSHGPGAIRVPAAITEDLARFLGLVIAEGHTHGDGNIWFTNSDPAVNDDFERLSRRLFEVDVFRARYRPTAETSIIFSRALGLTAERMFGLRRSARSAHKRVPGQLFQASAKVQWAFLSGLFEGDAHVHFRTRPSKNNSTVAYIDYTSASRELAYGVAGLLLRLGIFAVVRARRRHATNTVAKHRRIYYTVFVYGNEQLRTLAQHLVFVGAKGQKLAALLRWSCASNPNHEVIPGVTPLVREAVRRARVNVKRHRAACPRLAAYVEGRCQCSRAGLREVARAIVDVGETPEEARALLDKLETLATSDVYWDQIVSIEHIEPSDPWVYDLSVDETHNFVAGNIVIHNSNVADSIRWVLGEQSMRTLRGKKSDDVIFAGSQTRTAMQMAEVGLVLDNSASWLPTDFSEVAVSRRSFRSGDTEYLNNGQRVRLKDVLLLLAQARIGHDSYTVIGQGMVDQALSLRAEERRGLFEDAAGIRQFQAQRNDAEQKLTLTHSNLSRLRDIIGEIEPRLGPLAEQARRANEFTHSRDELMRLLRMWYRRQWRELLAARDRAMAAEEEFADRIQKLQDALAVEDGLGEELRSRREALVAEIAGIRRERGEATGRLQTAERELAVARERLASVGRQAEDLSSEQEQQADGIAAGRAHAEALQAQVDAAEANAREGEDSLQSLEHDLHAARQAQEREEARLRAAQRDAIQVQARLGALQTELGRLQRQLGDRNRVLATRKDTLAQAQRKLETMDAQLAERRERFEAGRGQVETLVAARETLARALAEGQAEVDRLRTAAADAQREKRALEDRLALLEEWRRSMEGFGEGVRALMQGEGGDQPVVLGLLAQLVTARAGLDLAVEAALGPYLQAVVMPSDEEAHRAAEWLRVRQAGKALFVWPRAISPGPTPAMPPADNAELYGFARDAVTHRPELTALVRVVLGDTYIVRDLAVALRRWPDMLPAPMVTFDGELLHPDGWLRGGKAKSTPGAAQESSVLARERELRQLPAEIDRLTEAIADLQSRHDRAKVVQAERASRSEALTRELRQAEELAQELAKAVAALQREQERAQSELQVGQTVVDELVAEVTGLEQEVEATVGRVTEQEQAQRDVAERVEDIQAEVDDILADSRRQQEELARARTAVAVQKQEAKALAQRAEQVRAQMRELQHQVDRRAERLELLGVQRQQLEQTIAEYDSTLAEVRIRARELGELLRDRETHQADLERRLHELERGQSNERQELARLEVEYRRSTVDSQRARDAVEALAQQIREELAAEDEEDPLTAIIGDQDSAGEAEGADLAGVALNAEEAAKMRRQIDQLRNRLKHLGGYDPEAPQAYAELKTRHDFLSGQVRDMEQASLNLRAVIAELDATMRRQFEETFHAVNERFQRNFVTLFSGGAARLELTAPRRPQADDDEEGEEAENSIARPKGLGGIEVYVQIPGKRVQDLSLLSGGERAMVSSALLFSLLETNPPPFCLLDEVDAALDEANVVRFCEILKRLSERTQFIIITHNRVTMTHATAIYGVSMHGDSVSRVLSMRLAEVGAAR